MSVIRAVRQRKRLIIAGTALIAGLLLLITSSPFQQWLLRRVEILAGNAGFPFSADRLRLHFTELTASLDGFVYDQNGNRVQIAHLNVDLPWNALRDGLHITNLKADYVTVNIRQTESLRGESPSSSKVATRASPPRIRIDNLAIRDISLTYSTPTTDLKIPSMSIEATDGRGVIRLDVPVSLGSEGHLTAPQIPFVLDDNNVRFGPATWKVHDTKYDVSGSIHGQVRWSPAIAVEADVVTDPVTIEKWKHIQLRAKAAYNDGVVDVSDLRLTQGGGELAGSARLSDAGTSADIRWKDMNLAPAGVIAQTDGALNLKWKAADWSDLTGEGRIGIRSRQYGNSQTAVRIVNRKATFDVQANAMDLAIRAQVTTALDQMPGQGFKELRGTARGTIQPLPNSPMYQKLGPVQVSATGLYRDNLVSIREIQAQSGGSLITGAGLQANLNSKQIRGKIPLARIELRDVAPDLHGTLDLSGEIAGSISQPTASFAGLSNSIEYGPTHVDSVRLDGTFADKEIRAALNGIVQPPPSAEGHIGPINVGATGTFRDNVLTLGDIHAASKGSILSEANLQVNLTEKSILGKVSNIRIDLSDFVAESSGALSLTADIEGTIDRPVASFRGSSGAVDIRGTHIDDIALEGTFVKDVLLLKRFEAQQAEGSLSAQGFLNVTTKEVHADAEVSDLKIDQVPDLSATASLKAKVTGTYESPVVDFNGALREVVYRQEPHGTVQVEGTTNLKTATVQANAEKYNASVAGEVTLEAPYVFDARLTAQKSRIRYQGYEAVADGRIHVTGQAQPFKTEDVDVDKFTLNGEGIELTTNGTLQSGVQLDGIVDLAELPIDVVKLEGTAQAHAIMRGSLTDPSIEGELTTTGAKVRATQMPEAADVFASVAFTGRDISIRELRAEMRGATAAVTGHGSWKGDGQLQVRIANVRPENFVKDQPASGVASLDGEVDIRSPRPEDISGRVQVTELNMTVRGKEIHQAQPIEVELSNQVLTVKHFEIEGFDTHATLTGQGNLVDRTLNFDADADTDLVILEPFIPKSHPSGRIKTRVSLRGTTDRPNLDGFVTLSGGELAIERPDVLLSELNVEAQLRGDRIELSRANGLLNSGMFEASGGTGLSAKGLQDAAIVLSVERGQLEFPEGLQSEFSAKLKLEGSTPALVLNGSIDVHSAIYEKDFNLTQAVFSRISSPQSALPTPGGAGDQIRMEVEVETKTPVLIKNNVADLEATGTFRVRGTAANPIIFGRALVQEGGQLYFGPAINSQSIDTTRRSDRYAIERGLIDFNNPLRTEPELDFLATHELEVKDERYLITLKVTGTPSTLKAELTSDPHEEQSDIVAMLLTGRTVHELQGTYADVAGEQALGYVSGRLSEKLLSQAGGVLGLNTVRIDPVTVADQTDLAARLTIAKDVTRDFSLIYSQYLNNAKAQTWIASYKPYKNLVLRGVNDAEQNEVIVDLKHDLRFGGGMALDSPRPENEARLRSVTFTGTHFSTKELQKKVTEEGKPFGSYRMTQDVRNLRRFLASQGYPKARIETKQSVENRSVDVRFDIVEGAKIGLAYEGADVPKELRAEIEQAWMLRPSDAASIRDSTARLLRHFRSEGYLQAQISADSPASTSGERRYTFKIVPGEKFKKPEWVFNGVERIDIAEPAGVVMESPEDIKELIESHFRSNGYLDVKSTVPQLVIQDTKAHFEVTVDAGRPYTVESIQFEGNRAFDAEHLREAVVSEKSKEKEQAALRFTPAWLETARQRITSEYWKSGYNDVQIIPSTRTDSSLAAVTAQFAIVEGEAQRIEAIEITGDDLTSRAYINRQFQFKAGDPVDYTKINLTRKKLYDTKAFRRVDIEVAPGANGHIARVRLNENAPWQLRYGVAVTEHLENGERQVGFGVDLSYNNLFGRGIVTGFSGKVNEDERDGRVFASAPQFFGRSATTSMTFFRTRDLTDPEDIVDYWGTTVQQQWRFHERYLFSYDYSYRKVLRGEREVGRTEDGDSILEDIRVPLARFGAVISRDTRDDILNATRGTFTSNSFEIAPPGIGSSVLFLRNYSQYFRFQSVKKVVLAGGIRFGFARPFKDQEMDPTLQFESGGGTTVRAFKQDELTREPGNYVLILNQEFRFPLFWKFSGVTFFDAGQVTNSTGRLFNFRYGPGLGIRIQTPFVLLRTDLGINVSSRPGEAKARWAFGIGQAF